MFGSKKNKKENIFSFMLANEIRDIDEAKEALKNGKIKASLTRMLQGDAERFSNALAAKMGLDEESIGSDIRRKGEAVWDIGDFTITIEAFCWNAWKYMFVAFPRGVNDAWEMESYLKENPDQKKDWNFMFYGTASVILPSKETQEKILDTIEKEANEGK